MSKNYSTQNDLLLTNLLEFYNTDNNNNMDRMLQIINGESRISLRIIDWFATNYAKKYYTVYQVQDTDRRFKVYNDYKLKLKAYSKKRFDPFCRRDRITIPYNETTGMVTTIGQLNFFKWAIENKILNYIEENYDAIENDMNSRNSISKRVLPNLQESTESKTRKKREELSISACKCIKKETVKIIVKFNQI